MTITDYSINAAFVLLILRQARERRLDARALLGPMLMMVCVAENYLHTIPTTGNDLVLIATLAAAGLSLGLLSGIATHVRAGADGVALARVGWTAGLLLVAGICSRMVFAFALSHGFEPAVRDFSIAQSISAAAWPTALVSMALCEVTVRLVTVHLRGRRTQTRPTTAPMFAVAA